MEDFHRSSFGKRLQKLMLTCKCLLQQFNVLKKFVLVILIITCVKENALYAASINLFKVNNKTTRTKCEIHSKFLTSLTMLGPLHC